MRKITSPKLSELHCINHGFFTRLGGRSNGFYDSLNCGFGSGDQLENVLRNRSIVAEAMELNTEKLCTAFQVHSTKVVTVKDSWLWQKSPEADALVTNEPNIALGIITADCVPVLLADGKQKVIGAAHAGWKGAIGGVLEATIEAMAALGAKPEDITVGIGPAIDKTSYEVGPEFRQRFLEEAADNKIYFSPSLREGHFQFDLKAYVKKRLERKGIMQINTLAHDTCMEENLFFSYRRSCLRGEPAYGRQISAIALQTTRIL